MVFYAVYKCLFLIVCMQLLCPCIDIVKQQYIIIYYNGSNLFLLSRRAKHAVTILQRRDSILLLIKFINEIKREEICYLYGTNSRSNILITFKM